MRANGQRGAEVTRQEWRRIVKIRSDRGLTTRFPLWDRRWMMEGAGEDLDI